jgi:RNase adapter protein RapZ
VRIIVVTGLSGAGKSTALRALEDIGFYCADNLPLPLVAEFVELLTTHGHEHVALSVDARQHEFLNRYLEQVARLRGAGHGVEVLFLEAPDEVLLRRYSETRRRHPLAGDELSDGIRRDRDVLGSLRADAAVLSTEQLTVHQLKGIIQERYGRKDGTLAVTLQSFGFKHGLPAESDLVFDVRFLPNPYFEEALSALDGRDERVAGYVLDSAEGLELIAQLERFLGYALPRFAKEGKLYLTVAVGCTGGRHRSVAVVEALRERLSGWDVLVRHRDLNRGL